MKSAGVKAVIGAVLVIASALVSVAAVQATGGLPAGLSGGTSGLEKASEAVDPSAKLTRQVEFLASFSGTDPTAAVRGLRRVRHELRDAETDIYMFRSDRGRPCVVVPDWVSFCEPDSGTSTPGLDWNIGGGDAQTPSRFIAVYSDDVAQIILKIDGSNVRVSMAENIAYAEFPADSDKAVFTAIREDGRENSVRLNLAG
jgi:hypothetical protein